MPNRKFCHSCGKETQLVAKFCPYCGTNLSSLTSTPPQDESEFKRPARPKGTFKPFAIERPNSIDEDDDYDPYENAEGIEVNISKLEVDIAPINRNKDTVGGLMSLGPAGEENRPTPNIIGAKEAIENFQKEGGALRPKSIERLNNSDAE